MERIEHHAKKLRECKTLKEAEPHLYILEHEKEVESIEAIAREGLNHKNEDIVQASANSLVSFKNYIAVEELIEHGLTNPRKSVQEISANAINVINDINYILTRLNGPRSDQDLSRVEVKHKSVKGLIHALNHDDNDVIAWAAWALSKAPDKKALPALMTLSGNENKRIRETVKDAIKNIQEVERAKH